MEKYLVQITDEAQRDLETIYQYIAKKLQAPETALKQYNRIADAIMELEYMPGRIKIMDSEPERTRQIRRMNVDNYSVFFIIREDRVIVTDVLYGASDFSTRLR